MEVLGRRGGLAELLRGLGSLSPAGAPRPRGRPATGSRGPSKRPSPSASGRCGSGLGSGSWRRSGSTSPSPAGAYQRGLLHPITQLRREVEAVFIRLGFTVVEGPEVEYDRYNFTLLNMPEDHPSRDMQDTFYVGNVGERSPNGTPEVLLRTHTSPVQIRTMLAQTPPIRVLVPGRAYRNEATDAAHEAQFSQVEGLCVDEHTTMGDLRGCLTFMVRALFGEGAPGALPLRLLPLRRARGGVRHVLPRLRRQGLPHLQGDGVDRDRGLRDGAPRGAGELRARSGSATAAGPSASASSGWPWCATGWTTSASSTATTCASCASSSRSPPGGAATTRARHGRDEKERDDESVTEVAAGLP